jgi:hypothetical protein
VAREEYGVSESSGFRDGVHGEEGRNENGVHGRPRVRACTRINDDDGDCGCGLCRVCKDTGSIGMISDVWTILPRGNGALFTCRTTPALLAGDRTFRFSFILAGEGDGEGARYFEPRRTLSSKASAS